MNENEENGQNVRDPNADSKNNGRYKYKNRRRKLTDSLETEGVKNSENAEQAKPNEAKKKKRNRNLPSKLTGNENWQIALAECIEVNHVSHETRSNPPRYNNSSEHKIRIIPLGGLGKIGGDISVLETNNGAIIIDLGTNFLDETMHGVDIIIPDLDCVRKIKDKIRGIVITHAHEDHIGTVPYSFKEFQFPIYATPLALGMIPNKFEERGLKAEHKWFRPVEKRHIYEIGEFEVEWIRITHSIIDASVLAVKARAGTIIHTGNFRIDQTLVDGYPTDLRHLAHYGEGGVMCLLSDSTNSYKEGYTKSENSVGPTFDQIFAKTEGRVIMSTFSSNIHRVHQAITYGLKYGRKVYVIGHSVERNPYTITELGYIKLDRKIFIDADEVSKYKGNEVSIVTTGFQGETMSALYRMATDEHEFIRIKLSDQVIISTKAIPGNEASVSAALDYLLKAGAKVVYQEFSEIHVSGHASMEEQELMLGFVKSKFFLSVHGEYNHITKYRETAMRYGTPERNIYLVSDGDQVEVCQKYIKRVRTIRTGRIFVGNQINKQITDDVIIDHQRLADGGIVVIITQTDRATRASINRPCVFSYGLVADKHDHAFSKEMADVLNVFSTNVKDEWSNDTRLLESQIRTVLRKHIFREIRKYLTIIPTLFVM